MEAAFGESIEDENSAIPTLIDRAVVMQSRVISIVPPPLTRPVFCRVGTLGLGKTWCQDPRTLVYN